MIDTSTDALFESIEIDGPELGPTGRPLPDLPEPQPPQGTVFRFSLVVARAAQV